MAQKPFYNLQALVKNSAVEISFYLGTPLFIAQQGKAQSVQVRIYRREEPEFTFNHDYAEYFDGLVLENAELVFEGSLELINHRKAVYRDANVKIGATYVYWVAPVDEEVATGPVAVRVRNPQIWWPQREIENRLQKLAEGDAPKTLLNSYGQTVRGREIWGLQVGNTERMVAFIGAVHPGESGPELFIPALERLISENGALLEKTGVAIMPSVCIDGREKLVQGNPWYLRKNYNEVDLNRNFPAQWESVEYTYGLVTSEPDAATYRGPAPCSEPETRAVMKFIEQVKPVCVFSFHCLASICGPSFFATKYAENDADFQKQCERFAMPYARGFYGHPPSPLKLSFVCTAGSLTSWLNEQWKIPGFDLEWDGEEKSKISHTDETTLELLEEYQERHYQALVQLLRDF